MPNWPHAPIHKLTEAGAYMITGGTLYKRHYFNSAERLTLLHDMLLDLAQEFEWQLEAWSVFTNHYHFVGQSPQDPSTLSIMVNKLHSETARFLNELDHTPGRQIWCNFWDSHITYERSYLARLQYVHNNALHHQLVIRPTDYRWCSAAWFEQVASPAFQKVLASFKTDKLRVIDDYVPSKLE